MNRYKYDGPVLIFGTCVANHWKGVTVADSDKKARSNLKYQYKKQNNLIANSRIDISGKLECERC